MLIDIFDLNKKSKKSHDFYKKVMIFASPASWVINISILLENLYYIYYFHAKITLPPKNLFQN